MPHHRNRKRQLPLQEQLSKSRQTRKGVLDGNRQDEVAAGEKAALEVCRRWANAGREAVIATPKTPGEDGNNILKRRARG
jgi:hypothetical protein